MMPTGQPAAGTHDYRAEHQVATGHPADAEQGWRPGARNAGVILATLSAIGNFLVLPYYRVWSVILIAVDVFIIRSLVSRERRSPV